MTANTTHRNGTGGTGGGPTGSLAHTRHAVAGRERDPSATRRTLLALAASALGAMPLKSLLSDNGWLIDVWLTMLLAIGPAAWLRRRRPPGALDIWPGLLLVVPWLTFRFVPAHAFAGFIPTTRTWHDLLALMDSLHHTTRDETAPVHSTVAVRLVLCTLLALLAALIDLIAVVGRRGALAGVPLLVVFTVSGAVPREPVSWLWFAFAAAGFLVLLGIDSEDELQRWGRRIGRQGAVRAPVSVPISAQRVGVVAIVLAILVPFAVPDHPRNLIADAFHDHQGGGSGSGFGAGSGISPFANLKGELNRDKPVNVLSVHVLGSAASKPPFYLRSNVLDEFTGSGWRVSDHGDTRDVDGRYDTDPPTTEPNSKVYTARITISGLSGNAPLFSLPTEFTGLDDSVTWSPQDQLLLGHDVSDGDSYTETFAESTPTAEDLRLSVGDIPADMSRWLALPSLPKKVNDLVDRLTRDKQTPYAKARAISDYFADPDSGFQYSLKTKDGDSNNDLVNFLDTKIGFCQQYAAAMGVMLRRAGVPARVVLGYMHPVPDGKGNFTVTSFDAHAWVEAYFKGIGWLPFDPTPVDGLDGGSKSDLTYAPHVYPSGNNDQVIKSRSSAGAAATASTKAAASSSASAANADRSAGSTGPPLWIGLGVLLVVALGLSPGAARLLRRRRRLTAARAGDPDPLWAELSDTAVDLGYVWSPARSPRQVAEWLARDAREPAALNALAVAVEQRRYGPLGPRQDTAELSQGLTRITAALRLGRSGRTRLRARLWPASLRLGGRLRGAGGRRRR